MGRKHHADVLAGSSLAFHALIVRRLRWSAHKAKAVLRISAQGFYALLTLDRNTSYSGWQNFTFRTHHPHGERKQRQLVGMFFFSRDKVVDEPLNIVLFLYLLQISHDQQNVAFLGKKTSM